MSNLVSLPAWPVWRELILLGLPAGFMSPWGNCGFGAELKRAGVTEGGTGSFALGRKTAGFPLPLTRPRSFLGPGMWFGKDSKMASLMVRHARARMSVRPRDWRHRQQKGSGKLSILRLMFPLKGKPMVFNLHYYYFLEHFGDVLAATDWVSRKVVTQNFAYTFFFFF